jgi:hypothetical protein
MSVDLFDDFMIPMMTAFELCQVTVVEFSSPNPTLPMVLSNLQDLPFSVEVQARMDETMFPNLGGCPSANPISALMNDYLYAM